MTTDSAVVSGAAVFDGAVTGLTTLDVTATTAINTTTITSSGTQDYQGEVTLGANANLSGSIVTFHSTVDDAAFGSHDLTVTGGAVFDDIVGATPLHSLHVTLGTTLNAGATAVTTSSTQAYDGAVTLGAGLTTLTGQGITFGDKLNGTGVLNSKALTIDAGSGDLTFTGAVGGIDALGAINITNAHNVTAAGILATSLTQIAGTSTTTLNGLVSTSAGVSLTTNSIDVANGGITNAAGGVLLTADTMAVGAAVNASAGSQTVTLREKTPGTAISLGTTGGGLSLLQSDLGNIKASILEIGDASAGSITVGAAINLSSANVRTLRLITGVPSPMSVSTSRSIRSSSIRAAAWQRPAVGPPVQHICQHVASDQRG